MPGPSSAPPKSILKKSTPPPTKAERDRETALYHAHLIQEQKDTESRILSSLEQLLELPSSPDADAARPLPSDVDLVRSLLQPFQPGDYDALIQERQINGSCGYVFCPRPPTRQKTTATFRVVAGARRNEELKVVPTSELERWCSDDCARRALYVKVQLDEEPAWTRAVGRQLDIVLYHETSHGRTPAATEMFDDPVPDVTDDLSSLRLDERTRSKGSTAQMLALERGERLAPSKSDQDDIPIHERVVDGKATPPAPKAKSSNAHLLVEGHEPGSKLTREYRQGEGDEDTDWGMS